MVAISDAPWTFPEYLRNRCPKDTPFGDFLRDAQTDRNFPAAQSWDDVQAYLTTRNACLEAIKAGRFWWARYMRLVNADQPAEITP